MSTDILTWMLPDIPWSLENHLYDPLKKLPMYTLVDTPNRRFWQIKADKGFPWDCNSWDENLVKQVLTDGSATAWASSNTFHQFVPPLPWAPRYLNPFNPPILSPTTYRPYVNGVAPAAPSNLGGPALTSVELIDEYPFGGDVGTVPCLMQRYLWGWTPNGFTTMETNAYVQKIALVQWQTWALGVSTAPVLKDQTLFNKIVAGGVPALVAPMGVPA